MVHGENKWLRTERQKGFFSLCSEEKGFGTIFLVLARRENSVEMGKLSLLRGAVGFG